MCHAEQRFLARNHQYGVCMTLNTSMAICSFFVAVFSALFAFLSVRQSYLQRKIFTKPQLVTRDITIEYTHQSDGIFSFTALDEKPGYKFDVPLINVGLGTALNINYKWQFDFDKCLTACGFTKLKDHPMHLARSNPRPSKIERSVYCNNSNENEYFNFDFFHNEKIKLYSFPKNNSEIEYLIPSPQVSQTSDVVNLSLPSLIPILLISQAQKTSSAPEMMNEHRDAGKLIIEYNDISDDKISIAFDCKIKMIKFMGNGENGPVTTYKFTLRRSK